jgi:hypothetical protein
METLSARRELQTWATAPVRDFELDVVWIERGYRDLSRILRAVAHRPRTLEATSPRNLVLFAATLADARDSLNLLSSPPPGGSLLDCLARAFRCAGARSISLWIDEARRLRPEALARLVLGAEHVARELRMDARCVLLVGKTRAWSNRDQRWSAPAFPPLPGRLLEIAAEQYVFEAGRLRGVEAPPEADEETERRAASA